MIIVIFLYVTLFIILYYIIIIDFRHQSESATKYKQTTHDNSNPCSIPVTFSCVR